MSDLATKMQTPGIPGALIAAFTVGLLPAVSSAQPADEAAPSTKVMVLPVQGIFRSVPQNKLDKASNLLIKELDAQEGLTVIRGAVAEEGAKMPSISTATAAVEQAMAAENERRIGTSVQHRKKALVELEKNAAALKDVDPYVQAHLELARALMLTGKDKEAKDVIEVAARLAPSAELSSQVYPRLYRRWYRAAVERALKDRRGKILVESILPGAMVYIDGQPTDVAPVLLEKVVPGKHLIVTKAAGVIPFATTVVVEPNKKIKVVARYANTIGGDAVGEVAGSLSKNKVASNTVSSAIKAGKSVGAKWVVFGAMARGDDNFRVHTYVVSIADKKVAPLAVASFDTDLLTAESDILTIVRNAGTTIEKFPGDAVASVSVIEKRAREKRLINKFNANPSVTSRKSGAPGKAKGKTGRRAIFKPLKGGTIQIKDEEED